MAFLMVLHEYLKSKRNYSKYTLQLAKASSRKEKATKQIERVQKMYQKREASLDNMAKMYQSSFKNNLLNSMGLGVSNQMFNPAAGYGLTTFVMGTAMNMFQNGVPVNGKDGTNFRGSEAEFQACMQAYQSGGVPRKEDGSYDYDNAGFNEEAWKAFNMCMQQAQFNQQQAQAYSNNLTSQYETNISIWLEAQKAQLEEEQDMALAPLNEQETEWELEETTIKVQMENAKAKMEAYKQALSEGIKDSAPTFGLG